MTRDELLALSHELNVAAFLRVIRACEGTADDDGYRRRFGGALFDSFADHPRLAQTCKLRKGGTLTSTAAGAYQILAVTWDEMVRRYQFPSFEPQWQDAAAVGLIIRRGALAAAQHGALDEALIKCAKEWASLPGSPYGQPTKTYTYCARVFGDSGGALA